MYLQCILISLLFSTAKAQEAGQATDPQADLAGL